MKKIITILFAVLVLGSFGMEAKTTKKSGKKRTATSKIVDGKTNGILKQIPLLNKLWSTENWSILFQNLGYDVTSKRVENELYDIGTYDELGHYVNLLIATKQFDNGGEVIFEEDFCGNYSITIKGMPKVLENYYKETKSQVKEYNRKYGDGIYYCIVEKHGDKIKVGAPCN